MRPFLKHILLLSFTLGILSCKKDKDPVSPTKGAVYLKYKHNFNGGDFALNTEYVDDFGSKYMFTRASFYLSKPQLTNSEGSSVSASNEYFLVHHNSDYQLLASSKPTTITQATINIGIDKETNHKDPSKYDAENPLSYQSPSMHWGTSLGYLFVVVEGKVDTDGDGTLDGNFSFHLGTDDFLNSISKTDLNVSIEAEKSSFIYVNVDYSKFFQGIDLKTNNMTHSTDEVALAQAFSANVTKAIRFE